MSNDIGKEEDSIRDYLFHKINLYKNKNVEIETLLLEKKEHINEIQQKKIILSKSEEINDLSKIFTPCKNVINNNDKIQKYVNLKEELQQECYILEEEIKKNNIEIDETSLIIEKIFNYKNKSDNSQDKFFGNYNILKSQEYENQRISRDLHDSVVQNLTSYIHKIELIQKFIDIDPNRCRLELELLRENIKRSINELRDIIYNLRPMSFDDIGMKVTLENTLNQIQIDNNIDITYKIIKKSFIKLDDIDSIISISLLRIIQEACSNSIRHGEAETIDLTIIVNESNVKLNIIDNGNGFDVNNICNFERTKKSGYGISIMRERVLLLKGSIDINSKINEGTKIEIEVPIQCEGE